MNNLDYTLRTPSEPEAGGGRLDLMSHDRLIFPNLFCFAVAKFSSGADDICAGTTSGDKGGARTDNDVSTIQLVVIKWTALGPHAST